MDTDVVVLFVVFFRIIRVGLKSDGTDDGTLSRQLSCNYFISGRSFQWQQFGLSPIHFTCSRQLNPLGMNFHWPKTYLTFSFNLFVNKQAAIAAGILPQQRALK